MDKIVELLKRFGVKLSADQTSQLKEVAAKEFVPAADVALTTAKVEELTKQLDEMTAKYTEATDKLAAQETDYAAEKLLSGYRFASDRVRNSVLAELKAMGFKCENGVLVGGKEYLEALKKNEPDVFAKEPPGLFMDSTQGNVSADANNLETQIFVGFGLKKD